MSNKVTIQTTEFKNCSTGLTTLGVRAYDDYDSAYDNTWESIPNNDLDVLNKCLNESDNSIIVALLEYVQENETGIYINDQWYEWKDIQHCFLEDVE